eukprot:6173449-Pleurochrysis_carterae.AAC.1
MVLVGALLVLLAAHLTLSCISKVFARRYGGGAGAAFSKTPMCLFLREHNPTERAYERAVE